MRLKMLVLDDASHDVDALMRDLERAGFQAELHRVTSEDDYLSELLDEFSALTTGRSTQRDGDRVGPLGVRVLAVSDTSRGPESVRAQHALDAAVADRLAQLHTGLTHGLEQRRLREVNRRAVAALLESEQRYRTLAESSAVGIWHTAADGRTLYVNPAMCSMLEIDKPEELEQKTYRSFFSPASLEQMDQEQAAAPSRSSWSSEVEIIGMRGGRRDVVCLAAPLFNADHQLTSSIRTFTDVTDMRRLQVQFHQAQKMEAVGRLAGGIAHDFNNLLTTVLTCCGLLQRRLPEGDPGRQHVDHIEKAVKRGSALTRQVLAFARQQILEPTVLDLNDVVVKIETLLRHLIGEDIELKAQLDPRLLRIKCDRGQIEQILMNLAVNARDAMPRGGHLTITTTNAVLDEHSAKRALGIAPGSYVCLTVTDTGCGMDETTRARIFEPFFTTKETGKGTGLGLSTVFGIVQQSRGGVVVDSAPGKGATFRVYFPTVTGESEEQPAPDEKRPKMRPGKETILLVDDEDSIRIPLAEFLRLNGYTVLEARNGQEAMTRGEMHEGFIHVLVTDVVMPKMGGKSLAERLTPRHPRMKVLYLSGYAEATIVRRGHLDAGAKLLQKPFAPETLVNRIHELLADAT
jgi:PAS domain S-box-containing protein